MKKLYAGLLVLLLVLSIVPAALADQGSDDSDDSTDDSDSIVTANADTSIRTDRSGPSGEFRTGIRETNDDRRGEFNLLRGNITARGNMSVRDFQEHRKSVLADLKERREAFREDRKAAFEEIKAKLKLEIERIKELRDDYKEHKESFDEAKKEAKESCSNSRSEECKKAHEELNAEAKLFMGGASEQMLRILANLETKVEANTNIGNETAADVIAKLQVHKVAIETAQAKIQNLTNSTDVNATKAAAAELKVAWQEARVTVRLTEGLLVNARFQEYLNQLDRMQTRFGEARDTLDENGKNVTKLDADLAAFDAKVNAAQTSYAQVQDSYLEAMASAKTEAEANTLLKSTRDQIKETRDQLQDAKQDLRAIIGDIRDLDASLLADISGKVAADAEANANIEVEA
jgi:hypothetical protein